MPGDKLPNAGLTEKYNSEAVSANINLLLLADDMAVIGNREELETGVRRMKKKKARFEERTRPDKEEELLFGQADSENIRMSGCCMGPEEDIKQRIRRARALWSNLREELKGSRLSRWMKTIIKEVCVENGFLFDCATRTWYLNDVEKLQSLVDGAIGRCGAVVDPRPCVRCRKQEKACKIPGMKWK